MSIGQQRPPQSLTWAVVARQARQLGFYPPARQVTCIAHCEVGQPESYVLQCPDECTCPRGHTFRYVSEGAERCTRCGYPVAMCGQGVGCLPEFRPER